MVIAFLKKRSILFYTFWLSLLIGEGAFQVLKKLKGCTALPSVKDKYFIPNVPPCDLIEITFVHSCIYIFIFSIAAYFVWYVFKCSRYLFRLVYKR